MKKYSSKFVLFEIQIVLEDQRDWESLIPTDGDENSNTQSLTHTDTLTHTQTQKHFPFTPQKCAFDTFPKSHHIIVLCSQWAVERGHPPKTCATTYHSV